MIARRRVSCCHAAHKIIFKKCISPLPVWQTRSYCEKIAIQEGDRVKVRDAGEGWRTGKVTEISASGDAFVHVEGWLDSCVFKETRKIAFAKAPSGIQVNDRIRCGDIYMTVESIEEDGAVLASGDKYRDPPVLCCDPITVINETWLQLSLSIMRHPSRAFKIVRSEGKMVIVLYFILRAPLSIYAACILAVPLTLVWTVTDAAASFSAVFILNQILRPFQLFAAIVIARRFRLTKVLLQGMLKKKIT